MSLFTTCTILLFTVAKILSADNLLAGKPILRALVNRTNTCPILNRELQICCDGIPQSKTLGRGCCGKRAYKITEENCCSGVTVARAPFQCCGKSIYNPSVQQCCEDTPAPLGPQNDPYMCCGKQSYNLKIQQCCENRPQPIGAPTAPLQCCGNIVYNPSIQRCCKGPRVIAKSGIEGCTNVVDNVLEIIDSKNPNQLDIAKQLIDAFGAGK